MPCISVPGHHVTCNISLHQDSREQLAIAGFARALLVIPKQLAVNAAQDATELVAKLRAFHNTSQTDASKSHLKWYEIPTWL